MRSCGSSSPKSSISAAARSFQASTSNAADMTNAGRLREPFEQREDARADVAAVQPGAARRRAGEEVQVVGLGVGQPQRGGDRGQDLGGRPRRAALFEPDVVLGGDVREHCDLLATQTRGPPPRARREADVLRPEPLAPGAQEHPELMLVHPPSLPAARRRSLVPPVPGCARAAAEAGGMTETTTAPIGLLTGKVVFITGASRGIGAAAARLFAAEGAAVVLAARGTDALDRVVAEIRAAGGVADAVTLDLADRASVRAAVDRVEALHGRLDGAFNNGAADPATARPARHHQRGGHRRAVRRQLPRPLDRDDRRGRRSCARTGGGAIVNTSSIGSRRANPDLPAYGAMKRALNSLTETAAVTWAPDRIRVNAITPGGTATEMIDTWEAATPRHHRQDQRLHPAGPDGRTPRGRRSRRLAAQRPRLHGHRRHPPRRRRRRRLSQ